MKPHKHAGAASQRTKTDGAGRAPVDPGRDRQESNDESRLTPNPGNARNDARPTATYPCDGRSLDEHHGRYLEERAVPTEFALRSGLYSLTAAGVVGALGLKEPVECGGIAIEYPRRDDTHPYIRVRLDNADSDGPRFLCPAGVRVPIYIANDAALDADRPLFVTEGPIKSLALANLGYASVGLGGVNTTHHPDDETGRALGPSWKSVPLAGRAVFIVFDAGAVQNPLVADAEGALARALYAAQADVRIVRIPLRTAMLRRASREAKS